MGCTGCRLPRVCRPQQLIISDDRTLGEGSREIKKEGKPHLKGFLFKEMGLPGKQPCSIEARQLGICFLCVVGSLSSLRPLGL